MGHFSYRDLKSYLITKKQGKVDIRDTFISRHLDSCKICWAKWNRLRWDLSKNSKGFKELQEYLGENFNWYFDASWALAEEWERKKPKSLTEIEEFYKKSENYLYSLTLWHESGDRPDYLKQFAKLDRKININSCLDYGCGTGTDGLKMLELEKKVAFYDFDNPSIKFLKWRLKKRKLQAKILYVGKVKKFPKVELIWAIDVLEHMMNPTLILRAVSDKTKAFIHVSQFGEKREGRHPLHLEFNTKILNRALLKKNFVLDDDFPYLSVWVRKSI